MSNPDGSEWVTAQTYDADGRLVKMVSGKPGQSDIESTYFYDEAGRQLSIANSDGHGGRTDFRYDEHGRKTSVQIFDAKALQGMQNSGYGGSPWDAAVAGVGVPIGGRVTTIYDANDRPTEAQVLDAEEHVVSRFVRKYNAKGQIIEEKPIWENPALLLGDKLAAKESDQLTPEQIRLLSKGMSTILSGQAEAGTLYTYDSEGRVTKIRERNMIFEKTTEITYNDQGDKAEEHASSTENSVIPPGATFTIDDNGNPVPNETVTMPQASLGLPEQSEIHYEYQYDGQSNWTQQTSKDSAQPAAPQTVRHRKITYY